MCYNIFILLLFTIWNLFSIFFRYDTFTDTISNILLTAGIIFSVFFGPDKHLQVFYARLQCGQ